MHIIRLTPLQLNAIGVDGPTDLAMRGRPSIAYGPAANAILDRLAELSEPYGTAFARTNGIAVIHSGD